MVTTPADIPPITPVASLIVPTPGFVLLHDPPLEASLNVIVDPSHTLCGPVMADGNGVTVMVVVITQPVAVSR